MVVASWGPSDRGLTKEGSVQRPGEQGGQRGPAAEEWTASSCMVPAPLQEEEVVLNQYTLLATTALEVCSQPTASLLGVRAWLVKLGEMPLFVTL